MTHADPIVNRDREELETKRMPCPMVITNTAQLDRWDQAHSRRYSLPGFEPWAADCEADDLLERLSIEIPDFTNLLDRLLTAVTTDEYNFDGATLHTDLRAIRHFVLALAYGPDVKYSSIGLPPDYDPLLDIITLAQLIRAHQRDYCARAQVPYRPAHQLTLEL